MTAGKRTRGNGEGSVFPRRDKKGKTIGWRGQQYIDEKRKSYSGKTKQDVIDAMALDRVDFMRGSFVASSDITVGQWAEYWLEHEKKPYVKQQTYRVLYAHFKNQILPVLSDYKLQDLTRDTIERAYKDMFVQKTKANGGRYSDRLIQQVALHFNSCLKSAVADGYLIRNPHDGAKLPKGVPPKRIEAYSLDEHNKLIEYLKASTKRIDWLLYLLLATGMREGEAIALTWSDIDFKKKTISINKTLVYQDDLFVVQPEPKSQRGNREISVPDSVVKFLRMANKKLDQDENVKNIVIPNRNYNYFQPDGVRERLQKICATIDIQYKGVHALRHSWATRCLEKGIPVKVVSEMLGHENIATTMNVYQSVLRDPQEEVATMLNELF